MSLVLIAIPINRDVSVVLSFSFLGYPSSFSSFSLYNSTFLLSPFSSSSSTTASAARHLQATASSCPFDFDVLRRLIQSSNRPKLDPNSVSCHYIKAGLRLVQSDYLLTTNNFLPPIDFAESCWVSYQTLINDFFLNFNDIRKICSFQTSWIAEGCMNIITCDEFEGNASKLALDDAVKACNQSLGNGSPCASYTTSLSSLQPSNLNSRSSGNLSDCTAYPSIYAAAFINCFGPTNEGTANCLFGFDFSNLSNSNGRVRTIVICVVMIGCGVCFVFGLWYTFDEIREATKNFSRLNIIGRGGYGNVYKGVLSDGSEVALKRFKNCSVRGDAVFAHEVEVIASVRHVNLVALRGYCTATTPLEGHHRIIVCDLMRNGSLHDHLFGFEETFLKIYERKRDGNGVSSHKMKAKETTHHFLRKYTVPDIDGLRTLEGIMNILMLGLFLDEESAMKSSKL
ncbi:putative LRR receptor-like serine/threonine-protein kinase RKF3 [Camellia lanceoleosa]|uniref:LRR receptor-like serine/threonine-protein kinase RKF3 n=1 Tax=Camellia lanceoleosa TaxID=1840588 RepID=A0ACC0GVU5_9ERIC|nr:putative LRR receptor-like serine/threonine-protein kinase RKF3 [Camellia lanceoleosa]